jgi:hydrogenase expression/formation protein HypC
MGINIGVIFDPRGEYIRVYHGSVEQWRKCLMCLGIPMQVVFIDGFTARCQAKGVQRDVNLFLMQDEQVLPGDYLVMQGGYATQKLTEEQALAAWEVYDLMLREGEAS